MKFEILSNSEIKIFYTKTIHVYKLTYYMTNYTDFSVLYHENEHKISIFFHIINTSKFIIQEFHLDNNVLKINDIHELNFFVSSSIFMSSLIFINKGY